MRLVLLSGLAKMTIFAVCKWYGSSGGDFTDSSHDKVMKEFLDDFHRHLFV
jgi:hypothetical protein